MAVEWLPVDCASASLQIGLSGWLYPTAVEPVLPLASGSVEGVVVVGVAASEWFWGLGYYSIGVDQCVWTGLYQYGLAAFLGASGMGG